MDLVGVEPTPLGLKTRLAPARPGPETWTLPHRRQHHEGAHALEADGAPPASMRGPASLGCRAAYVTTMPKGAELAGSGVGEDAAALSRV